MCQHAHSLLPDLIWSVFQWDIGGSRFGRGVWPSWKTHRTPHGVKHSPSDSPLGGNIGKPGGPPLCMAWTPLDRFFSHWKNVPEVIRGWDCHDFWRSFAWRSRFFCGGTATFGLPDPIGHFLGVIMSENTKNEHEEAAQAQPNKNICKNKTTCQFSSQSVD